MGWIDRVPRAGNLNIGGLYALYQAEAIKQADITHVLSVIDFDLYELQESNNYLKSKNYKHHIIQIDDDPNENLLQHFDGAVEFIKVGLKSGGGVFVHCAMGKSRSATIICAYLMHEYGISPDKALAQLREGRGVCGPNPGFMEQLDTYHVILKAKDAAEATKIYEQWLETRFRGDHSEWERRHHLPAKL